MSEQEKTLQQTNEDLRQTTQIISKTFLNVTDCYEERLSRIKKLLDAGVLDEEDSEYYSDQVVKLQKRIIECEAMSSEQTRKIERIIINYEEEIKKEQAKKGEEESTKKQEEIN